MIKSFPNLGKKSKDIKGLLKGSLVLLGRDKDIFKPAINMTFVKSINILIIYYALYSAFVSKNINQVLISILSIIFLIPIITYLSIHFKAITSWMVFEILKGRDTDLASGRKAVRGLGITLFVYAILDMMLNQSRTSSQKKSGIGQVILSMAMAVFSEVWDLVKNFSLPAIVIDKVSIREVPEKLKGIKKNVPASLVGILGIDLAGGLATSLTMTIQLPCILIALAIGFYLKDYLPEAWNFNLSASNLPSLNALPVFICSIICAIAISFLNSIVQLVKTTYFTSFYVSLEHPDLILDKIKPDLTHYLNLNNQFESYELFDDNDSYDLASESAEDKKVIRRIALTYKNNIAKGMSKEQITGALEKKGYRQEQLDLGFNLFQNNKESDH